MHFVGADFTKLVQYSEVEKKQKYDNFPSHFLPMQWKMPSLLYEFR